MENLSHSRNHPNRSTASTKKPYNGNGGFISGKPANTATTYDDVFGGPPRFGPPTLSPRLEDYCEIFSGFNGSSRAAVSSIPVLDLPLVDGKGVYFDVRRESFDYREVFGGFNDLDLAPSYEELFMQQRRRPTTVADRDSSDDAWTPEEAETEHSEKSPSFSNGRDSYDSIDGCTEFNISYHKASTQMNGTNISSGVTRVADLGGYTVAVDEMVGRAKVKKETGPSSVGSGESNKYSFQGKDGDAQKYYNGATSYHPSEPFVTVSEIGLKTHPTGIPPPSRPPPVMKTDFRRSGSNGGSTDGSSSPFFDVEVDASSSAVRDAMVKAEVKLKSAKEMFEKKQTSMNNRMREEGKSSQAVGLPVLDSNIDVARKSLSAKNGSNKSLSSQGSVNSDGNEEWEEATQFVELVRTEQPRNADENSSGGEDVSFPLNAGFFDQKLTWSDHEAKKLPKHPGTRKLTSRDKRHEDRLAAEKTPEETKNEKLRDVELQFEIGNRSSNNHGGIVKHRNLLRPEENKHFTGDKVAKQKMELHSEEKTKRLQNQQSDRKAAAKNQNCVFDWEQNARKLREALRLSDNESTLEVPLGMNGEMDESDRKLKEALRRMEEETSSKEAIVNEETEAFEKAENEKRLRAALEEEEKVKKLKEAREKEENEKRAAEARQKAEEERKMKEQEEYELRLKEAFEKEEEKRRMREAREKAEQERRMKEQEEYERKLKEAFEKEEKNRRMREAREKAENERKRKEAREKEENERRIKEAHEKAEMERRMKELQEKEAYERRAKETLEQAEKERKLKEAREKEENEKKLKEAIELEEKEKRLIEAFERAETERRLKDELEQEEMRLQEGKEREERERTERENQERLEKEMKRHKDTREDRDERQGDTCEMEKTCETTNEEEEQWLKENLSDTSEEDERVDSHKPVNTVLVEEEGPSQRVSVSEEAYHWKVFEKNLKDASQKEGTNELDTESGKLNGESGEESVTNNVQGGKLNQKSKKSESNGSVGGGQRSQEESKCATNKASSGFRNQEDATKLERPLPSRVFMQREKEAERLKRELDSKMERLRKIEEEREREREREKDRMAFDQRALADARERLEKACAEARERSFPDKAAMDARLRAERAAVERATAEARERAAEKAAFEARDRMERSVSDKQFQSSGLSGERMERSVSDKQFQNSASFGASRYQNSPGADGESPQRYTSRLERHRRTADRVAKALAEKNMRDLVAQREQAERTRIAETLDAEVKRWSSGKEGNIRALLSTLQYILGSESGWQPIPLTEVITSAAVKRAYRKATLCVHPDKLQQRGANIHQKYICEKVFDLLKEAWNRFNSEER